MSLRPLCFIYLCLIGSQTYSFAQGAEPEGKPKFGALKCRIDAQLWTSDLDNSAESMRSGLLIMVNGKMRNLSQLTYGATVTDLIQRAYEMQICMKEDSTFQNQFNTYQLMRDEYQSERTFRYLHFVSKHNLDEQFSKEDAEDFKSRR